MRCVQCGSKASKSLSPRKVPEGGEPSGLPLLPTPLYSSPFLSTPPPHPSRAPYLPLPPPAPIPTTSPPSPPPSPPPHPHLHPHPHLALVLLPHCSPRTHSNGVPSRQPPQWAKPSKNLPTILFRRDAGSGHNLKKCLPNMGHMFACEQCFVRTRWSEHRTPSCASLHIHTIILGRDICVLRADTGSHVEHTQTLIQKPLDQPMPSQLPHFPDLTRIHSCL